MDVCKASDGTKLYALVSSMFLGMGYEEVLLGMQVQAGPLWDRRAWELKQEVLAIVAGAGGAPPSVEPPPQREERSPPAPPPESPPPAATSPPSPPPAAPQETASSPPPETPETPSTEPQEAPAETRPRVGGYGMSTLSAPEAGEMLGVSAKALIRAARVRNRIPYEKRCGVGSGNAAYYFKRKDIERFRETREYQLMLQRSDARRRGKEAARARKMDPEWPVVIRALRTLATGPYSLEVLAEAAGLRSPAVSVIIHDDYDEPPDMTMKEAAEYFGLEWDGPDYPHTEEFIYARKAASILGVDEAAVREMFRAGRMEAVCRNPGSSRPQYVAPKSRVMGEAQMDFYSRKGTGKETAGKGTE